MLDSQINILKMLKHSNILLCHQILKTVNHCYIITQLCQDGDLSSLIKKKGKLPEQQALLYFKQILEGFSQIAKNNILHRDLKPANIFIRNGQCKIADFGFAKLNYTPGIRQKYNVGSPLYMSPQSLKQNIYTIKNDIWSLGVIFYQMLFGKTPWQCKSQKQLINKITNVSVSFPTSPPVSQGIKSIIRKCLFPQQNQRATLQQIYKELNIMGGGQLKVLSQVGSFNIQKTFSSKCSITLFKQNQNKYQKENIFKSIMSKQQAIQKINICRLIFKLYQQLSDYQNLVPQLRKQLIQGITQLKKQNHSERVAKVIDQYYLKYSAAVVGKPQREVHQFKQKSLKIIWSLDQWGKQLLSCYLAFKEGIIQHLGQVLDKAKRSNLQQIKNRLIRAGIQ